MAEIRIRSFEQLKAFKGKLSDLRPLLKIIGSFMVSQTQDNFKKQSFGRTPWLPRYPSQKTPKINVAGALTDMNAGSQPKARRLQDRPTLQDTGNLMSSLTRSQVIQDDTVRLGTAVQYADRMQNGGTSEIPVTKEARKQLAVFLKQNPQYGDNIGFLFNTEIYKIKNVARPFLGFTNENIRDIAELTEEFITS